MTGTLRTLRLLLELCLRGLVLPLLEIRIRLIQHDLPTDHLYHLGLCTSRKCIGDLVRIIIAVLQNIDLDELVLHDVLTNRIDKLRCQAVLTDGKHRLDGHSCALQLGTHLTVSDIFLHFILLC